MIHYVTHTDIDTSKWDNAIRLSFNKLPYVYSWYLDLVSPNWDALILDDYRAVMPLTKNKKIGISYIYTPFLSPQLGVFSTIHTSAFCVDDFIHAIPSKFKVIDITLNSNNYISDNYIVRYSKTKYSQELRLTESYDIIKKGYSKSHVKNIAKFATQN